VPDAAGHAPAGRAACGAAWLHRRLRGQPWGGSGCGGGCGGCGGGKPAAALRLGVASQEAGPKTSIGGSHHHCRMALVSALA